MNIRGIRSRSIWSRSTWSLVACCMLATPVAPAFAGLGAAPTPARAPAATAGAQAKSVQRPGTADTGAVDNYTTNEIHTAAGGVVTEYVSKSGVVFGISWRTPMMPDLHELLGAYFPSYEQAASASRSNGRRGPVSIDSPDLVLQSGGRMRDYRGSAYVPGLLPPNVPGDAIK